MGPSREGFVIENLIAAASPRAVPGFYRTSSGAEIDLLLDMPGKSGLWAIEIKRSLTTKPRKGFHIACADLDPKKRYVVHSGNDSYPLGEGVEVIGLRELAEIIARPI